MERKELLILLFLIVIVYAGQLIPTTYEKGQPIWITADQIYYLAQINHFSNGIIGDIAFVQSENPAIMVLPFWVINNLGKIFGNANVLFFWIFFSVGIIVILLHIFLKKLGYNPTIGILVFFFGNSGIHLIIKGTAIFWPQLNNFRWTGIIPWHAITTITNIYHPLGNIEIICLLVALILYLNKQKRLTWEYPFLAIIIFFSRTYMALIYAPFFFLLEFSKNKKINYWWGAAGIIPIIYYLYFRTIPEWITYTNVYFQDILHTPVQWAIISSWILVLLTLLAIKKEEKLRWPLIIGLAIYVFYMIIMPLNDRYNFFKANIVGLGGAIGIYHLSNKKVKTFFLLLMLIQVPIIIDEMGKNRGYLYSYQPSEEVMLKLLENQRGVLFAPEGISVRALAVTSMKTTTTLFWWGEPKQKQLDVKTYYSDINKGIILDRWNPDFVWEYTNYEDSHYKEYLKVNSIRLLKRVE